MPFLDTADSSYVKPTMLDSDVYETRRQSTGSIALRHVSVLLTADLYLLLHNQTKQANCVHHIEKLYSEPDSLCLQATLKSHFLKSRLFTSVNNGWKGTFSLLMKSTAHA
jgi:hypothetical protein